MTKKMTKKEKFEVMAEVVKKSNSKDKEMLMEFISKELELLAKRSSKSGETAKQKENEKLKEGLLKALKSCEDKLTISEFQAKFSQFAPPKYSNQKLSAMFSQMREAGLIDKKVEKKKSYFYAL